MSDITITINGIECKAKEGEYILNIARRNNIFIPAICYLTGCSPTLACRICLVEADGKRVYSCNAKAKDGMQVITDNEEIAKERRAIMEVYDVNHPLQCGVCDQSGECELQNYTLYMGVDKQHYAIRDTKRESVTWGPIHYDAGLCIVCERCITVCKDMIGDAALKTVPRGGDKLSKELKEEMPKDAYAMWNKLQKSIIGPTAKSGTLECSECGECIAVCPVGALVSTDFQYTSNAWELRRIPAANPHSSDCSLLYYEVKHTSVNNPKEKIYRVTNDFHYTALNGAARFGYDFQNEVERKDEGAFKKAIDFIREKADTIKFNSFITNEEALILQKLREKFGFKLINEDAKAYQDFMKNYSKITGKKHYSGSLKKIKESNFVICMATAVRYDSPNTGYAINNAVTMNKGAGLYFHPIDDQIVNGYAKNMVTISHEAGAEEYVIAFVLKKFGKDMPKELKDILDKVSDEKINEYLNLPEDFDKTLTKMLAKKDKFSFVIGADAYTHPKAKNLAKLAGAVERYTDFDVVVIPSQTNTLGVSLICDLGEHEGENVLGYNEKGDFTLSALGDGDLDMPALNQQEGTFTNIDKRVVPTNAALEYKGYCLNDIANALGVNRELTIDYTKELPQNSGYVPLEFDLMPNFFDNGGNELRGYILEEKEAKESIDFDEISKIEKIEGQLVYKSNPINQFSPFTNKAHQLNEEPSLYVSKEFLESLGVKEGEKVLVEGEKGSIEIKTKVDIQAVGNTPYLPTFDPNLNLNAIFPSKYRFAKVSIKKV